MRGQAHSDAMAERIVKGILHVESLDKGHIYSKSAVHKFTDSPGTFPSDRITILGAFEEN